MVDQEWGQAVEIGPGGPQPHHEGVMLLAQGDVPAVGIPRIARDPRRPYLIFSGGGGPHLYREPVLVNDRVTQPRGRRDGPEAREKKWSGPMRTQPKARRAAELHARTAGQPLHTTLLGQVKIERQQKA